MQMQHRDSDKGSPVFEKGYPCWEAVNQERYHNFILRKEKELREENEASKQSKQPDSVRNESNEEGSS